MAEQNYLIPVEKLVPEDVFKEGGTDPIISKIKSIVDEFVSDTETAKGRAEIKSFAFKVTKSKTFLLGLGDSVAEKYRKIIKDNQALLKPISSEQKKLGEELDALKDQARKPLTDWENEQARIKAEAEALEKYNSDWDQAIIDNDLFNREREIARKEAELKRKEEERKAKEESERLERERIEREERLKKEAAEQAKRDAEEATRREREEAVRKQIEAEQAAKRAEEEKKAAEERAKREAEEAERKRLADIKVAEEKAERDKQAALEAQRRAQEEKEQAERDRLEKIRQEEERRKADVDHRGKINRYILGELMGLGLSEDDSKAVITAVAKGEINYISINY